MFLAKKFILVDMFSAFELINDVVWYFIRNGRLALLFIVFFSSGLIFWEIQWENNHVAKDYKKCL